MDKIRKHNTESYEQAPIGMYNVKPLITFARPQNHIFLWTCASTHTQNINAKTCAGNDTQLTLE